MFKDNGNPGRFRRGRRLGLIAAVVLGSASALAQESTLLPIEAMFGAPNVRQSAPSIVPRLEPQRLQRPKVTRREPRVERPQAEQAEAPTAPVKNRSPGEMANPVPDLLKDATLRAGDIVMFPDGPRVFAGRPSDKHKLSDFVPVTRMAKLVPKDTRKYLTSLRPGLNGAWETETSSIGRVADNVRDVTETGSVRRSRR